MRLIRHSRSALELPDTRIVRIIEKQSEAWRSGAGRGEAGRFEEEQGHAERGEAERGEWWDGTEHIGSRSGGKHACAVIGERLGTWPRDGM